jgi:hypothetical protein
MTRPLCDRSHLTEQGELPNPTRSKRVKESGKIVPVIRELLLKWERIGNFSLFWPKSRKSSTWK